MSWYDDVDKQLKKPAREVLESTLSLSPSTTCVEILDHFEGFSEVAYQDVVGVWTIGHGITKGVKPGDTITYKESIQRKLVEMDHHWRGVQSHIESPINQDMCDAITSFTYNVGIGAVRSSTFLKVLNDGDYSEAANQLLRWNKAGGKVYRGLTRRRNAERNLFLSLDWREYAN